MGENVICLHLMLDFTQNGQNHTKCVTDKWKTTIIPLNTSEYNKFNYLSKR